jgi:hypothetical protein
MEFQLERHTQIILAVVSYAQTPPQVYRNVLSAERSGEVLKNRFGGSSTTVTPQAMWLFASPQFGDYY